MNVSLTPRFEKMVKDEIKSGRYSSASEVVRDALRLFQERKAEHQGQLERLRREVQIGLDQLDRGEGKTYSGPEGLRRLFEDVKRRGRKRLGAKLALSLKKNSRR